MQIMCCDETNAQASKNVDFFVYGGLVVSADKLGSLNEEIEDIRHDSGFNSEASLKFRSASRPIEVPHEMWTQAKAATIAACQRHEVKLITSVIHHKIAQAQKSHMTDWQLNTCLDEFNRRLEWSQDYGLVIIDRISDQREYSLLRDKFRLGGTTPWGKNREFKRVVSYSSTSDGASHLASATDVILGSLAFCINQRSGDAERCRKIYCSIEPMLWTPDTSSRSGRSKRGLIFSPAQISAPSYARQYDELRLHLDRMASPT